MIDDVMFYLTVWAKGGSAVDGDTGTGIHVGLVYSVFFGTDPLFHSAMTYKKRLRSLNRFLSRLLAPFGFLFT